MPVHGVGVDELWDCVGRANPHLSYTGPTAVLPFAFPIWGFYRQAYHHDNNQHGSNKGSLLANQPWVPHKKPRKANLLWTPHGLAYLVHVSFLRGSLEWACQQKPHIGATKGKTAVGPVWSYPVVSVGLPCPHNPTVHQHLPTVWLHGCFYWVPPPLHCSQRDSLWHFEEPVIVGFTVFKPPLTDGNQLNLWVFTGK